MDRLRHTDASLVLVSAPLGYGKTTLLAQWAATDRRPLAWLRITDELNDAQAFLLYLMTALAGVAGVQAAIDQLRTPSAVAVRLRVVPELAAAVSSADPFMLVLDDAHLLEREQCWHVLGVLLEHVPPGAVVAIGSRREPPLPLPRLRASGDLYEVGLEDLRMDRSEARALLEAHAGAEAGSAVDAVLAATEGWAAGIYLSALVGAGAHTTIGAVGADGGLSAIAEYLTAEVLDRQPEDIRTFLLQTSVLDQLSPSLCDAVTERSDADVLLAKLWRDNLLVSSFGGDGIWYRYHHLFGGLLLAEFKRGRPAEVAGAHRRAAAWYRDAGDGERAVRHAVAAGEAPSVATLAAQTCVELFVIGQYERAVRLADQFGDEQIREDPSLALTVAFLSIWMPEPRLRRWERLAMDMDVGDADCPLGASTMRSFQALIRAALGRDGIARMREDAELVCMLERHGQWNWLCQGQRVLAIACLLSGRLSETEDVLDQAEATSGCAEAEGAWVAGMRAFIAADRGLWGEAAELDRRLQPRGVDYFSLFPLLAHALLLAHTDEIEAARYVRQRTDEMRSWHLTEWRALLRDVVFGEIWLRLGDVMEAERWTRDAERLLERYTDAGILLERTRRLRQALEHSKWEQPLTTAERRVLDLLATQLSAPQIAARLFISRNTVKSHVKHIYDKLGVRTRTEAVERARELGLVQSSH